MNRNNITRTRTAHDVLALPPIFDYIGNNWNQNPLPHGTTDIQEQEEERTESSSTTMVGNNE